MFALEFCFENDLCEDDAYYATLQVVLLAAKKVRHHREMKNHCPPHLRSVEIPQEQL
jgi:hypothetical protein